MGVGKYLSHEDLIAAFTLRSKRLVTQETLGRYHRRSAARTRRSSACCSSRKISSARRTSASWPLSSLPVLNSAAFENFFQNPKLPALCSGCSALAQLQARVRRCGFVDVHAGGDRARSWTGWPGDVEPRGKLFEAMEAQDQQLRRKGPDPAEARHRRLLHRGPGHGPGRGR